MKTLLTLQIQKSDSVVIFENCIVNRSIKTESDFNKTVDELIKNYGTSSIVILFMKEFAEED